MSQQQLHINIIINNSSLKISLSKIRTVLHLSLLLNKSNKKSIFLEIPRFCFHPRLPIAGNCRMCLIELFKAPKLVVACTTRVQEGMVLFTNSILVKKAREYLLEFFLANHPLDCPICDQGGECDLQNQLEVFGLDHTRYTENIKKVAKVVNIGVVSFQMTRCIQCTRCVRFLTTVVSNFDLGVIARGGKMKISKYLNTYLYNEFLSNIVDLCPVGSLQYNIYLKIKNLKFKNAAGGFFYFCGALTTASSAYRTRSWELYSKYTIDILDNIGADIRVDLKGTDIIRVLPRLNVAVNDHWITELTRYSFNGLKVQRLLLPYYKSSNNKHIATTWSLILDIYSKYIFVCNSILKKKLNWAGITSNLIDSKTAISFKRFLQANGSSNIESRSYQNQELLLDFVDMFSLKTVVFKESTIIFLIGINLRLEVPFYYLKIKQKKNLILFLCGAGVAYFSNYVSNNIQSIVLSSTIKSFIKIIEGRSVLSHYFVQLFSKKQNSLLFLLGASVTQRKDCLHICNIINYWGNFINSQGHWKKQQIYINIIQPHLGRITANTLNLIPSRSTLSNNNSLFLKTQVNFFKNKVNILFNQGTDDFKNLNILRDNTLHVFLGHTAFMTKVLDFLLPTCTFFEKETLYLNIENVLRESKLVLAPYLNMNVMVDWQIFFLLKKKIYMFLNVIRRKKKIKFLFLFNKFLAFVTKPIFEVFFFRWFLVFEFALFNFNFFKFNYFNFFLFGQRATKSIKIIISNLFFTPCKIKKIVGNLYYQKYIYLSTFTTTLFNTLIIDNALIAQLLTHSRLFRIQNQYSSKALSYLHINSVVYNIKFYLINYPFILKYRTYFISNIISQNTLDMTKIKYNLQQKYTNYAL